MQTDVGAVAEKPAEPFLFVRRGDDEHLPDTRQHQRRQRVVHHRLAVDRDQLLADRARQRMQARTRTAGEEDAFQHHVRLITKTRS